MTLLGAARQAGPLRAATEPARPASPRGRCHGRPQRRRRACARREASVARSTSWSTMPAPRPARPSRKTIETWQRDCWPSISTALHLHPGGPPGMLARRPGASSTSPAAPGSPAIAYVSAYVAAKHGVIGSPRARALNTPKRRHRERGLPRLHRDATCCRARSGRSSSKTGRTAEEARAALAQPIRRAARDPEEVADAVLWLCGPGAESITGQAIAVAGGEVMTRSRQPWQRCATRSAPSRATRAGTSTGAGRRRPGGHASRSNRPEQQESADLRIATPSCATCSAARYAERRQGGRDHRRGRQFLLRRRRARDHRPADGMTMPELLAFTRMTGDLVKAMRACPQPIIAAIDGICAGAGAILAMASDLRLGTAARKTAFLFTRVGLAGCDMGACATAAAHHRPGPRRRAALHRPRDERPRKAERWGFFNASCARRAARRGAGAGAHPRRRADVRARHDQDACCTRNGP